MTKRQLIEEIVSINRTAEPGFLAQFNDADLDEYLRHLELTRTRRVWSDPNRYAGYFRGCPTISAAATPSVEPAYRTGRFDEAHRPYTDDENDEDIDAPDSLDLNLSEDAVFRASYEVETVE